MKSLKRNQIEEAISVMMGQGLPPSPELKTKLKRLLDADRDVDRKPRSRDPEFSNYAFYSGKSPGRGGEVQFSGYEAFAVFLALSLMEHGLTQARAVLILRRVRRALERKHKIILGWDPRELFDQEKIRAAAQPGSLGVNSTRPVFLAIENRSRLAAQNSEAPTNVAVLEPHEFGKLKRPIGSSLTLIELTYTAHRLRDVLAETSPSKRGRPSL
jgi:hypothetical protein